jgi:hypothetical protein
MYSENGYTAYTKYLQITKYIDLKYLKSISF